MSSSQSLAGPSSEFALLASAAQKSSAAFLCSPTASADTDTRKGGSQMTVKVISMPRDPLVVGKGRVTRDGETFASGKQHSITSATPVDGSGGRPVGFGVFRSFGLWFGRGVLIGRNVRTHERRDQG